MSVKSFVLPQDLGWSRRLLLVVGVFALIGLFIWLIRLPVATSIKSQSIIQVLGDATRAVVTLQLGANSLELDGASPNVNLIEGRVETLSGIESLEQKAIVQGSQIFYSIKAKRPNAVREQRKWSEWSLHLNPRVPLELSVSGGFGDSELNLRNLNLASLRLVPEFARYAVMLPEQGKSRVILIGGTS